MGGTRSMHTGGELVVEALQSHGIDTVFCVPGESFLPILDALYGAGGIRVVTCRHEHGAAMMAEAHGKLTGRPALCLVTRGPGACNAAIGVHTAFQDSTPMLLFIGQVERGFIGREAFQEVDLARMFQGLAKRAEQVEAAAALPAAVASAVCDARSGRPGPVVLALPEDVLAERVRADAVAPLGGRRAGARRGVDAAAASSPGRRPKAAAVGRRRRLDGGGASRSARLCRRQRPARLLRLPPPRHLRQCRPAVRGRARHRRQPGPGRPGQGRRPGHRRWHPLGRDHHPGLHPAGAPGRGGGSRAGPGSRLPRRRRAGPRLRGGAGDPRQPGALCRRGQTACAGQCRALARLGGGGAAPITLPIAAGRRGAERSICTGRWPNWTRCSRPTPSSASTPATSAAGRSASSPSAAAGGCSGPATAPWATPCRRRSRQSWRRRSAASSPASATAASA